MTIRILNYVITVKRKFARRQASKKSQYEIPPIDWEHKIAWSKKRPYMRK